MRAPIKHIITGIDVGTHSTRVVVVEHTKGENTPRIIGTGFTETRGLRHGYIVNKADATKSIGTALAQAEKMSKTNIKNAILSIGGIGLESMISHGSSAISRATNEVSEQDIKKSIEEAIENLPRLANKRIIYQIPLRYKLDGKEVLGDPAGMTGAKLEVKMLFATCLEQHLDDIINVIEELGVEIDPDDVIPSPIAAGQVALTKKQRSVGCALVNVGAETVSISVFENDIPISLQVFPIGSTDITNDIALGLKIPLEQAEKVKLTRATADPKPATSAKTSTRKDVGELPDGGTYSKKKLDEIIEARLFDIFELLESHLKKINRSGLLPAGIILTGGGVGIATIEDLSRAILKLPSSVAHPMIDGVSKTPIKDSSWLVAYGLTLYILQKPRERAEPTLPHAWETLKEWVSPFLP